MCFVTLSFKERGDEIVEISFPFEQLFYKLMMCLTKLFFNFLESFLVLSLIVFDRIKKCCK